MCQQHTRALTGLIIVDVRCESGGAAVVSGLEECSRGDGGGGGGVRYELTDVGPSIQFKWFVFIQHQISTTHPAIIQRKHKLYCQAPCSSAHVLGTARCCLILWAILSHNAMHNISKGITFVAGITKTEGGQQSWNSFNERLIHFFWLFFCVVSWFGLSFHSTVNNWIVIVNYLIAIYGVIKKYSQLMCCSISTL